MIADLITEQQNLSQFPRRNGMVEIPRRRSCVGTCVSFLAFHAHSLGHHGHVHALAHALAHVHSLAHALAHVHALASHALHGALHHHHIHHTHHHLLHAFSSHATTGSHLVHRVLAGIPLFSLFSALCPGRLDL